jgi:hypothetical protein
MEVAVPRKSRKTYSPKKRIWIIMDALSGNIVFSMSEPPDESDMYENEVVYEYELRRKYEVKSEAVEEE